MVVVRCLILCSKFAKNVCRPGSARTRWGSLQRSTRPGSWGKKEIGKMEGQEGEGRRRKGQVEEGKGKRRGGGCEGYPLQMKILATALHVITWRQGHDPIELCHSGRVIMTQQFFFQRVFVNQHKQLNVQCTVECSQQKTNTRMLRSDSRIVITLKPFVDVDRYTDNRDIM